MRRLLILAALLLALPAAAQTYRAAVITPWQGAGTHTDPFRPKLAAEHALLAWDDVTGQPVTNITPSPNAYTLEIQATGEMLDLIEDDADYVVLWTQGIDVVDKPAQAALPWSVPWVLGQLGDLLGPRNTFAAKPETEAKVKPVRPRKDQPGIPERVALRNGLKLLGYSTAAAKALVRDGVARAVIQTDVVAAQKIAPKG